jgi:methylthioribose-1-phosphate isomerase
MENTVLAHAQEPVKTIKDALKNEAKMIMAEDETVCHKIGINGLSLLSDGYGVLTHCNAGRLAAYGCGTALAPLYLGHEKGYRFKVFADETRPLLQGARLTTYELMSSGIDTTLICDNMASVVLKNGWIDAVLVGCDCVAANGDVANKIGTSGLAILAKHYGIPFYVCAPASTIDISCIKGADMKIEERPAEEITGMWYRDRMAPENVKVYNPAFDVTEHSLISAIITEYGIIREPYKEKIKSLIDK